MRESENDKVVLLHGFSDEQALKAMRAVKAAFEGKEDIAFCVSTPTNAQWKVSDLVKDVRQDHEYLKKNPPGQAGKTEQ